MLYLDRIPAPPLDTFVASIWYCENDPRPLALERVLPSGAAGLVVNLKEDQTRLYRPESGYSCETSPGAVLSLSSRYCVIDTTEQECVIGVVFKPGGTVPFFRVATHELRDVEMPVEGFRERLLEAPTPQAKLATMERLLSERFTLSTPHAAVSYALAAFAHHHSIAAVTGRIALSPKRFIEHFKAAVGVTPKHYCRIQRFQRTLALAEKGHAIDWTRVAHDCGYFDQAHFIHDFRAFSGITPTGYQAGRTEFRNHVKFLQSSAAAS
jgi:AraC-like DNA-binding protein